MTEDSSRISYGMLGFIEEIKSRLGKCDHFFLFYNYKQVDCGVGYEDQEFWG